MKLFQRAVSFLVPTFYGGGGGGGNTTSKVIYDKATKAMRNVAFDKTNEFLKEFENVPEAQQWLNNWYSMSLDQQEAEWKRLQSNVDSVASNLLSGGFDTNFAPVDNVATPTGTDFNEVDGETSDFVKALSGGTAKAAEATGGGAGWIDALLSQTGDYKPVETATTDAFKPIDAASSGDYVGAKTELIKNIGTADAATNNAYATATTKDANYTSGGFRDISQYLDAIANTSPEYQNATAQFLGDYSPVNAQGYDASLSDLSRARQSLGAVDPTQSLQQLLTGQINQPYLSSMHDAYINDAMRGYGDAVQKLNQETMPNIGSEAFAAGQYGGSRQGIAQGLAMQQLERNARDLGIAAMDSGSELYGNAYQQAQDKMYGTANNLNSLAVQNEQFNASAQNQAKQFTADAFNNMAQFNATNNQANQKYNADIANQMSQFNAGNLLNKGQFDTNALNDLVKFNSANNLQNQQFGVTEFNKNAITEAQNKAQVDIANSNNWAQVAMQNAQLQSQQDLANMQAQNEMEKLNLQTQLAIAEANAAAINQQNQFNSSNQLNNQQFNAGLNQQTNEFNATNGMSSLQFNTNWLNQMGQFNATNDLQNQQFNTGQANDMSLANSQGSSNAQIASANNSTQASIANANNATQTSQFNSELLTELSKFNAGNAISNDQFNAGQLNNLGLANSTNQLQSDQFDATNLMNNNQFNANLGLQNNTQQMQQTGQNLQNALTGLSTQTTGLGNLQQALGSIYSGQSAINNYDKAWALDNLDIAKSAASMSPIGTITSTSGGGGNPLAQLGGAAMSGLGVYGLYQGSTD